MKILIISCVALIFILYIVISVRNTIKEAERIEKEKEKMKKKKEEWKKKSLGEKAWDILTADPENPEW